MELFIGKAFGINEALTMSGYIWKFDSNKKGHVVSEWLLLLVVNYTI